MALQMMMFRCPTLEDRLSFAGNTYTVEPAEAAGGYGIHARLTCRGRQRWQRALHHTDTSREPRVSVKLIHLCADRLGLLETTYCQRTGHPDFTVTAYDDRGAPRYDLTRCFAPAVERFWVLSEDTLWTVSGQDHDSSGQPTTHWLSGVSLDTGEIRCSVHIDHFELLRQWGPIAQRWVDVYGRHPYTVEMHWRKGTPRVCYSSREAYSGGARRVVNIPLHEWIACSAT